MNKKSPLLESERWPIHSTVSIGDTDYPWEVLSYEKDFHHYSDKGGFFDLSFIKTLTITGEDTTDFLHRLSTLNCKTLPNHTLRLGAFLTGRATAISSCLFEKVDSNKYRLHATPRDFDATLLHLQNLHFSEKIEFEDSSQDYCWLAFNLKDKEAQTLVSTDSPCGFTHPILDKGQWFLFDRKQIEKLSKQWRLKQFSLLGLKLFEYLRITAGFAQVGVDTSDKELLLEAGLEKLVDREKGCYPGQEVVERIFTYGKVNRRLMKVKIQKQAASTLPKPPWELYSGNENVGKLTSVIEDPGHSLMAVGLAYLKTSHCTTQHVFSGPREDLRISICLD